MNLSFKTNSTSSILTVHRVASWLFDKEKAIQFINFYSWILKSISRITSENACFLASKTSAMATFTLLIAKCEYSASDFSQ